MKRIVSITISILFPVFLLGQQYETDFIISVADSLLKNKLGDSLFSYAKYDKNTYYKYISETGETCWKTLNKDKNTKGKFVEVDVRWDLEIPFPNCPELGTIIKGRTSILLDSMLNSTEEQPYLAFIPDIYWTNEKCQVISEETAIKIAKSQNLKKGIESLSGYFSYNREKKIFIWHIYNVLSRKHAFNDIYSKEVEIIEIDASTGNIINHDIFYLSPI